MSPIPKGLKMVCVFSIESKYLGLSTQYNLIMKETKRVVLSAKKEHFSLSGSKFMISLNRKYITKRKDNQDFAGRL